MMSSQERISYYEEFLALVGNMVDESRAEFIKTTSPVRVYRLYITNNQLIPEFPWRVNMSTANYPRLSFYPCSTKEEAIRVADKYKQKDQDRVPVA